MSVKLALLKSGETIISEVKELVSEDSESDNSHTYGYIFSNPEKVYIKTPIPMLVSENTEEESSVQVSLSPWIVLTKDKDNKIDIKM